MVTPHKVFCKKWLQYGCMMKVDNVEFILVIYVVEIFCSGSANNAINNNQGYHNGTNANPIIHPKIYIIMKKTLKSEFCKFCVQDTVSLLSHHFFVFVWIFAKIKFDRLTECIRLLKQYIINSVPSLNFNSHPKILFMILKMISLKIYSRGLYHLLSSNNWRNLGFKNVVVVDSMSLSLFLLVSTCSWWCCSSRCNSNLINL